MSRTVAVAALLVCAVAISHDQGMTGKFLGAETPEVEAPESNLDKYPVSTTAKCIISITIQYMVVYLALAVVRTYHEVRGTAKGSVEAALAAAAQTLTLGPMLCVLFIACRMRVVWLSQGTGDPQMWVQYCMYGCTYAVLASTLLVLTLPLVLGQVPKVNKKTGDLESDMVDLEDKKIALYSISAVRYLILLGMYAGVGGVIVGICLYEPPAGTWPGDKIPPPAPAVMCTMLLSVAFFAVYLFVACCKSFTQLTGRSTLKLEEVMLGATRTMEFAPMLCILFLAARMRALQMDPVNGAPQKWAQSCFYMCTVAVIVQTGLAIAVPLVITTEIEHDEAGNVKFVVEEKPIVGYVLTACRYIIMLSIYVGFTAVIVSIFLIEHPKGPEHTIPISPTVQCVINLTLQFFFIYLLMWIMMSIQELTGYNLKEMRFYAALEAARATVMFAPMLAILFVATRMRALQMSDNKGAPQRWAQDGMYMSTWAVLISFLMCLIVGLFMKVETDEDGNVVNKFESLWVAIPIITVRYLTMLLMYGGIITVVVSAFLITPETANGRGSVPVVSDAADATGVGHPPPGPNQAPGVPGFFF
jgi:hypothetical protein